MRKITSIVLTLILAATLMTYPALAAGITAKEQAACSLVNDQRAALGLQALTVSSTLSDKARIKAQDMAENRYFSHNSPTYGSPFTMMRQLGITYRSAGENIAMGYTTAADVVEAWMASPSHRDNLLSTRYTTVGVGYAEGYWAQWFIG